MAFVNSCDAESSSPYCICTDYYGNILPEYREFDTATQTFTCCNELKDYAAADTSGDNWVLNYVSGLQQGTNCSNILNGVTTDTEFKQKLPLLYYQGLFNGSLFRSSKFSAPVTFTDKTITCSTGNIPYLVSYPNYSNGQKEYKVLCGSSVISSLQNLKYDNSDTLLDYSLNYILQSHGENCNSSSCITKFDVSTENEYNIGDVAYNSPGNINSDSVVLKWWFWFMLLMIIFVVGFGIYYLYYHGMSNYFKTSVNYLNSVKKGLGNTARKHAKKNQKAHFHMNT